MGEGVAVGVAVGAASVVSDVSSVAVVSCDSVSEGAAVVCAGAVAQIAYSLTQCIRIDGASGKECCNHACREQQGYELIAFNLFHLIYLQP